MQRKPRSFYAMCPAQLPDAVRRRLRVWGLFKKKAGARLHQAFAAGGEGLLGGTKPAGQQVTTTKNGANSGWATGLSVPGRYEWFYSYYQMRYTGLAALKPLERASRTTSSCSFCLLSAAGPCLQGGTGRLGSNSPALRSKSRTRKKGGALEIVFSAAMGGV